MKKTKRYALGGILLTVALFLSGCMRYDDNNNPTGWFYEWLVVPTINLIDWLANLMGGNYGLAIIALTILVRIILIPMTLRQQRSSTEMQVKMNAVKPVMDEIQSDLKEAKTQEEQLHYQQEIQEIYQQADINPISSIGCLPLLIQLPIISMVFQAINLSPAIAKSSFLGIQLGERSVLLAILAAGVYLLQSFIMMKGVPEEQQGQMRSMMLMNPLMIGFFSLSSPAGVALYWITGGLFSLIQTFITNSYIKPQIEAQVQAKIGDIYVERKPKPASPANKLAPRKDVTPGKKGKRNAGKQKPRQRKSTYFESKKNDQNN